MQLVPESLTDTPKPPEKNNQASDARGTTGRWMKLLSDVDKDAASGCWLWNKYRMPSGYGRTRHKGRNMLAHRFAFLTAHPVAERELLRNPRRLVCHKCDNPPCCNPAHLFLGSHKTNTADAIAKGRTQSSLLKAQAAARFQRIRKLSHAQVDAIRTATGPGMPIAKQYNISLAYVGMIRNGKRKIAPRNPSRCVDVIDSSAQGSLPGGAPAT